MRRLLVVSVLAVFMNGCGGVTVPYVIPVKGKPIVVDNLRADFADKTLLTLSHAPSQRVPNLKRLMRCRMLPNTLPSGHQGYELVEVGCGGLVNSKCCFRPEIYQRLGQIFRVQVDEPQRADGREAFHERSPDQDEDSLIAHRFT